MTIDPFILIQKGDIVELNREGVTYFGSEYEDKLFIVIETTISESEKESCTDDNNGIERVNCTCYRDFNLMQLDNGKIIRYARYEEIILKEIA